MGRCAGVESDKIDEYFQIVNGSLVRSVSGGEVRRLCSGSTKNACGESETSTRLADSFAVHVIVIPGDVSKEE